MALWSFYRLHSSKKSSLQTHPGYGLRQNINSLFTKRFGLTGALFLLSALALATGGSALSDSGQLSTEKNSNHASNVSSKASASQQTGNTPNSDAAQNGVSTSVTSQNVNGESSTQVTVNGQQIEVPENGSTTKTIDTDSGQATVTVNNQSSSDNSSSQTIVNSNTNSSNTSSQVNINSEFRSGQ